MVYAEMPADVSEKFDIVYFVSQSALFKKKRFAIRKIKVLRKLFSQTLSVVVNLIASENLTHFRFTAGIAD